MLRGHTERTAVKSTKEVFGYFHRNGLNNSKPKRVLRTQDLDCFFFFFIFMESRSGIYSHHPDVLNHPTNVYVIPKWAAKRQQTFYIRRITMFILNCDTFRTPNFCAIYNIEEESHVVDVVRGRLITDQAQRSASRNSFPITRSTIAQLHVSFFVGIIIKKSIPAIGKGTK